MRELIPVYTRILLRYGSPVLVTLGLAAPETAQQIGADPDIIIAVGAGLAALTEAWYVHARRHGGPT